MTAIRLSLLALAAAVLCALGPAPAAAASGASVLSTPGAAFLASPRRKLEQTVDCSSVANCVACRMTVQGRTVTVCDRCKAGYHPSRTKRECWCDAGYQRLSATQCDPCGYGHYCPGAKSTASQAVRIPCGDFKNTTGLYGRDEAACVTLPGYGWTANNAVLCPRASWSAGLSARRCVPCANGMTTVAPGAVAPSMCLADVGRYFLRGKAFLCAQGSYKETIANEDCMLCPTGFTTAFTTVGAATRDACNYVVAGFAAAAGAVLGTTNGTMCPVDTYRASNVPYDSANGVNCTACPTGMVTNGVTGATSEWTCLAPPGWGYDSGTNTAKICARGWYKEGYNRNPCVSCGSGSISTDAEGATHADSCYTPAGHRSYLTGDGLKLHGEPCLQGTFGRENNTYGLAEVECAKCLENTDTLGTGSASPLDCVTKPGYGYERSATIEQCDYGRYSPGYTLLPCYSCGPGYNTTAGGVETATAILGATSAADCVVGAGWEPDGAGGIKPCLRGFYKELLGNATCSRCPNGTSTQISDGAAERSDCNSCSPGFYNPSIDLEDPGCSPCPSGSWAAGRVPGGNGCTDCAKPSGYTGAMVSIPGSSGPEACVPEFPSSGTDNDLDWDLILMSNETLSFTADADAAACQAACSASTDCQYFVYNANWAAGARCALRDKVPYAKVDLTVTTKSYAFFEVKTEIYVAYPAHATDAASLGSPLASYASEADARVACKTDGGCHGYKFVHTEGSLPWRTFKAVKWEAATGKVRAQGANLNPWAPANTGSE